MRKNDRKKGQRKMIVKSTKRRMVAEKSNKENSNRRKQQQEETCNGSSRICLYDTRLQLRQLPWLHHQPQLSLQSQWP